MISPDRLLVPYLKPIQTLLDDPSVTEIMVTDGGRRVFYEANGSLRRAEQEWRTDQFVSDLESLATTVGLHISDTSPLLEMRLPDGSRVSAAVPPCSTGGAALTIRRFGQRYSLTDLLARGAMTMAQFDRLGRAVTNRKNILISGGTGSGKTTLLNAVGNLIHTNTRIVLIEDLAEIFFKSEQDAVPLAKRPHVVRLQTLKDAGPGADAITITGLMRHALRQRPDVLILGEVRTAAEAFELLQVFNSGHQGSMSTIHANHARHAVTRFAHLLIAGGIGLPLADAIGAIREVVDLVVHVRRTDEGRKVSEILDLEAERC